MEDMSDNGTNRNQTVMKITNNGPQAATHVVLTIQGSQLSTLSEKDIFDSNNIIKLNDTKSNIPGIFQLSIPRLAVGAGSYLSIILPNKPERIYLTYDQGSVTWPKSDELPVYIVSNFKLIIILSILAATSFASSFVWRLFKRVYREYQGLAIAKSGSDMERVARELKEFPYLTKRYWWKRTKPYVYEKPKFGKVEFTERKVVYKPQWFRRLFRRKTNYRIEFYDGTSMVVKDHFVYSIKDDKENDITIKDKNGTTQRTANGTPVKRWKAGIDIVKKSKIFDLDDDENISALYSTEEWNWKNRLAIKLMEESDHELFKEFYSKLLARDQAIASIIDNRLYIYNNNKEMDDEPKREYRLKIEKKTFNIKLSHFYDSPLVERKSIKADIKPLEFSDLKAIYEVNKDMQIAAEKCHRSIRWSSYNIDQKMIAVEQEKHKTIRKLTVAAVIAAVNAVPAFLIAYVILYL